MTPKNSRAVMDLPGQKNLLTGSGVYRWKRVLVRGIGCPDFID